jgi:hypothetical protein
MDHVRGKHGKQRKQTQDHPDTVGHLVSRPYPTLMTDTVSLPAAASHEAPPRQQCIVVAEMLDMCKTTAQHGRAAGLMGTSTVIEAVPYRGWSISLI